MYETPIKKIEDLKKIAIKEKNKNVLKKIEGVERTLKEKITKTTQRLNKPNMTNLEFSEEIKKSSQSI